MATPAPTDNYYAILELPPTAAPEAITKSYRRLALLRHPDRNPGVKDATAMFQLLQNAYETLSSPTLRRAYDISFFHHQHHHAPHHHHHHHQPYQQPSYFNAAANPSRFRPQTRAKADRRAAAEETARQTRFREVQHGKLSALAAEASELKSEIRGIDKKIRKVEEELKGLDECDAADEQAEKEARNPRTWFWNLAGMAARKGRIDEEGRRATERRHREEGRRVRCKEVEARRREREGLMEKLEGNQRRYWRVQMETIEEFEEAEKERMEWERKEEERMKQAWTEQEMERARRMRAEWDRFWNMEGEKMEKMEKMDPLFEEFSERIETEEERNRRFWQEECYDEEVDQSFYQETGEEEWRFFNAQPNVYQGGGFSFF